MLDFIVSNKEIFIGIGIAVGYLLAGFFAALLSRVVSKQWYDTAERESFTYFMPFLGPIGLLVCVVVYLFLHLPTKLVK